jgi:hypothetical protein
MTMAHWNLHRPRRDPRETTAYHVRHAARWLNEQTRAHAGRSPITSDMVADLVVMAQHGDLMQITVEAYQNGTTVASWLVRVTEQGYHPRGPASVPGDRALRYRVVPGRAGQEHLYRHLLRCTWAVPVSRR